MTFDLTLRARALAAQFPPSKGSDDMSNELVSKITDLGAAIGEIKSNLGTRLGELERRVAGQDGGGGHAPGQSLAEKLAATPQFKELTAGNVRGRAFVEMAAITTGDATVGSGRSAATSLVPAERLPGIVTPAERELTVRDLIAPGQTSAGSLEYVRETGFSNNARPVAEWSAP